MWKAEIILLILHQEDFIQERRLQVVDGSLDLHSYGKEKNFGQVTVQQLVWEMMTQKLKGNVKASAVQLVNDVFENVEKQVSNWCKLKRMTALVLIYLRRLLLKDRKL